MIMIGLVMYNNYQTTKLENINREFDQLQATGLVRQLGSLSEIGCSDVGVTTYDCLEIQKLQGFREAISANKRYYREMFGSVRVYISWVYAPSFSGGFNSPYFFNNRDEDGEYLNLMEVTSDEEKQILIDFKPKNVKNKIVFHNPIMMVDRRFVPSKNYFGWMSIEVYNE